MKYYVMVSAPLLLLLAFSPASAQLAASHAQTAAASVSNAPGAPNGGSDSAMHITGKPVVRVNGAVLTDIDLLREMLEMFPYARMHDGFPKAEEAQIRRGALNMIEFEELVYQEAERRKMTISPERLQRAEVQFRNSFTPDQFNQFMKVEMKGSRQLLRQKIRRSLLIEALLKQEVNNKSKVSLVEARAFYDHNPKAFEHGETFNIQTISFIPPVGANSRAMAEARKKAEDALRQAKATKSYEEFGLLAEKVSEDDYRVNMGDHKVQPREALPPEILKVAEGMKPGQISDILQIGNVYTFFRLNTHTAPGEVKFEVVKGKLMQDMEKAKLDRLRVNFDKKLRQNAKVEEL